MSVISAAALGIGHGCLDRKKNAAGPQDARFFAGFALAVSFAAYGFFFKLAALVAEPWYCIPFIAFIAVCCDVVLPRMHQALRSGIMIVAVVSLLIAVPG